MLEVFSKKVMDFMSSPTEDKKEELKKIYNTIKESKDIAEDKLKSVERVYSYVDWVLR